MATRPWCSRADGGCGRAISARGATISGAPDFAYDLCARTATEAELASLDLSRWRVAFTSGEQVRAETLSISRPGSRGVVSSPGLSGPCMG